MLVTRNRARLRRRSGLVCAAALVVAAWLGASCGARTGLYEPPPKPPGPECVIDSDCDGYGDFCNPVICKHEVLDGGTDADASPDALTTKGGVCVTLPPVNCDDNDPCTSDTCDSDTGKCLYAPATLDLDGDGHRAPLPGTVPGAPGSCGDDCDDTNPNAHPGGIEVCDGADNDCNGIVDDNATYVPLDPAPVRVSGDIAPAGPGGLAWSGTSYVALYSGGMQGTSVYEGLLDATGNKLQPESLVTLINADASGAPIIWVGDRFGLTWQDRRDSDYEIYFNELSPQGGKVYPDTRITFAAGFSVNPSIAWTGLHFVLAWEDDRDGQFNIYAQVIGLEDTLEGSNVAITMSDPNGLDQESPSVAAGSKTVGIAWTLDDPSFHMIEFQTFDAEHQLTPVSSIVQVTNGGGAPAYPTVVWNKDRYVIAWYDPEASPAGIYGAAFDENGTVIVPPRPITTPAPGNYSRYPFLKALGDRLLVIYSDDRDQNAGYELYDRMITKDLEPLGGEQRLTFAPTDSVFPTASFGPNGDVGILFRDSMAGEQDVYFLHLGCMTK